MTDPKPTERIGGTAPSDEEARDKGDWAARAQDGIVPAELGGSDAPRGILDDDPELGSEVLGGPGSDEPATSDGIDLSAGDNADAVTDGGPKPSGPEPDQRDAAFGARQSDIKSAEG
jgi:hypothetical protein